ncbi:hypothetical protein A2U01_0074121, partial [Trifolium medium]|nr:hypothetical protein [Trifolium medium]
SWVEEFYANAFGHDKDDFTSHVRGVEISYALGVIDEIFGFRPEEAYSVRQRRTTIYGDVEYDQMLHELAMPGKDVRYNSRGGRSRLQGTEMMPIAKA